MKVILQFDDDRDAAMFGCPPGSELVAVGTMLTMESRVQVKEVQIGYRSQSFPVANFISYEMRLAFNEVQFREFGSKEPAKSEPVTPEIFERMRRAIKLE